MTEQELGIPPATAQERIGYTVSVVQSFFMILLNEIADKSFICVVLFSINNSKVLTFILAMTALTAMNILAITVGFYIPVLVYKDWIDWFAIFAFTCFGVFNIYKGITMKSQTLAQEIEDHEHFLENETKLKEPLVANERVQAHNYGRDHHEHDHHDHDHHHETEEKREFVLTGYLAFLTNMVIFECGDKTQVATIVIATIYNPIGVFIGTTCGFAVCVILAISCGKLLGQIITEKTTSIISGVIFLLFACQYLYLKLQD
jgi:putative Ca2+/H+ antiporter (TMEM165/GDT1 family)